MSPLVDGQVARPVTVVVTEAAFEQFDQPQVPAYVFPYLLPIL